MCRIHALGVKNSIADRMLLDDALALIEEEKRDRIDKQRAAKSSVAADASGTSSVSSASQHARAPLMTKANNSSGSGVSGKQPSGSGRKVANNPKPSSWKHQNRATALSKPTASTASQSLARAASAANDDTSGTNKGKQEAVAKAEKEIDDMLPAMMSMKFRSIQRAAKNKAKASK